MINRTEKRRRVKGKTPLVTTLRGSFMIPDETKRLIPKGGVRNPISMLITMIIPKWIGSTWNFSRRGRKIGPRMRSADTRSIKQPRKSRNILTRRRKIQSW